MVAEQCLSEFEQRGGFVLERVQTMPPGTGRSDSRSDVEQLLGAEPAANFGPFGCRAHIVDTAEVQVGPEPWQLECLGRSRLATLRLVQVGGGRQIRREGVARGKTRVAPEQFADGIELEGADREAHGKLARSSGKRTRRQPGPGWSADASS